MAGVVEGGTASRTTRSDDPDNQSGEVAGRCAVAAVAVGVAVVMGDATDAKSSWVTMRSTSRWKRETGKVSWSTESRPETSARGRLEEKWVLMCLWCLLVGVGGGYSRRVGDAMSYSRVESCPK